MWGNIVTDHPVVLKQIKEGRKMDKYGVRVYPLDSDIILVKQTVKRAGSPTYVVDTTPDGEHREAHVRINNDREIAEAVRAALRGKLKRSVRDL